MSDEWITFEQVVAQAVAPFVETVGDAAEAARAVLEALREAGFDVLAPGEYALVKKVDGRWPMTNRVFNAIEDALVRETGSASMRTIETVVETYLDALAEGEQ